MIEVPIYFERHVGVFYYIIFLHLLANHITNGMCGILFHLRGDAGIGVQCEPCGVETEGAGQGFHARAVLQ